MDNKGNSIFSTRMNSESLESVFWIVIAAGCFIVRLLLPGPRPRPWVTVCPLRAPFNYIFLYLFNNLGILLPVIDNDTIFG